MKILWVTYAPLGRAAQLIENKQTQSGTWIDAAAKELIQHENIELGIASIASHNVELVDAESGIKYWGLGRVRQVSGSMPSVREVEEWKQVVVSFKPDVIMVWGTEYANGISVINAAGEIPVLFFIQGVIGKITNYPLGKLPMKEVFRTIDPISILKFVHFHKGLKRQKKQKGIEIKMLQEASGIITDNQWADSYYRIEVPNTAIHHVPLPINKSFLNAQHSMDGTKNHSIFTIDGCNPAKGIFHLLKAVQKVKRVYSDVHLYIPGRIPTKKPEIIFESPYYTYLKKIIKKLDIEENVTFCGQLSGEQMKEKLLSCQVFVMPSCIENHSASLREAMYLGVPCITTLVGSVDEFTQYGEDVLSYRYEEDDVLADSIIRVFSNRELAEKLGNNAFYAIRKKYPQDGLGQKLYKIYEAVK